MKPTTRISAGRSPLPRRSRQPDRHSIRCRSDQQPARSPGAVDLRPATGPRAVDAITRRSQRSRPVHNGTSARSHCFQFYDLAQIAPAEGGNLRTNLRRVPLPLPPVCLIGLFCASAQARFECLAGASAARTRGRLGSEVDVSNRHRLLTKLDAAQRLPRKVPASNMTRF